MSERLIRYCMNGKTISTSDNIFRLVIELHHLNNVRKADLNTYLGNERL